MYFIVSWREATAIRRELEWRFIPYEVRTLPDGSLAFVLPDLPPQVYARVRIIFGGNGLPIDNFGR